MKVLVRLYPKHWRERYGEELTALIEEQPSTLGDVFDIILGAADAWRHRHLLEISDEDKGGYSMATRLIRMGGVAAIVSGVLSITFLVDVRSGWGWDYWLLLGPLDRAFFATASALCLVLACWGFGALYLNSRLHRRTNRWSALAPLLTATAFLLFSVGIEIYLVQGRSYLTLPYYTQLPGYGLLLVTIASLIAGIGAIRSRVVPRWVGILLVLGACLKLPDPYVLARLSPQLDPQHPWLGVAVTILAMSMSLSWIVLGSALLAIPSPSSRRALARLI